MNIHPQRVILVQAIYDSVIPKGVGRTALERRRMANKSRGPLLLLPSGLILLA